MCTKLLRLDEIVSVALPSLAQDAARDLVRAREDVRGDLMRARHGVSKLLLHQGIVYYGGSAWTGVHLVWLRSHRFDAPGLQAAFDAEHEAVLQAEARRDRLDKAIVAMPANSEFTPVVHRLGVTAAAIAARLDDATWDVVTADEPHRTLGGPDGGQVTLHDIVVGATRRR